MMETVFVSAGVFLVVLVGLCLIRAAGGPTVLDRILGGNMIGTKTTVLLLLIGLLYGQVEMFVDIALAYALLNFIATLGATRFFLRRRTVHLEEPDRPGKEGA